MNKRTSVLAIAAAIGVLGAPATASAFTLGGHINGEAAFSALGARIDVAAEGRIGDLSGAAEHEFNIHDDNGSGQTVLTEYRYFDWVSGRGEDFAVTFDDRLDLLTYEIGGQTLTYNLTGPFEDIFIRTTARKQDNSVVVDNLMLNGTAIGATSSFTCSEASCGYFDSSQYLWIADIEESFTLTGTTTMSWTGNPRNLRDRTAPHRSELAFQIKLGQGPDLEGNDDIIEVPEPASMSLFSIGALGLLLSGLRHRQQQG